LGLLSVIKRAIALIDLSENIGPSERDPLLPVGVLSRPPFVPLTEFQKHRRLRESYDPHELRSVAEMNDVTLVVLFFNRYAIIRTFLDKSSYLSGVRGNIILATTLVSGSALTRCLRSAFSMTKPPDRPFGIVALLKAGGRSIPEV